MKSPLTVVHGESSPSLGGQELRILLEMEHLAPRGIRSILVAKPGSPIVAEAKRRHLLVHEVSMRSNLHLPSMLAIAKVLRTHAVDVINVHNSKDAWNIAPVGRLLGIPIIRARHIANRPKAGFLKTLPYGPLCDAVLTTSESIKQGLTAVNIPAEKIDVIPTGVDCDRFAIARNNAIRKEFGIPAEAPLIGQIAVLRSDKGGDHFARAAVQLLDSGVDAWFLLVGEGRLRSRITAIIGEKYRQRILLTGYRRDIPEILSALDIFVLAARSPEGIPQAILQAHSAQVPVVASQVGGINEVAITDKTALTVPPGDSAALAQAIEQLLENPALGKRLASAGNALVQDRFTLPQMLDRMESLYRRLAAH